MTGRPMEQAYDCTVCGERFSQRNHMYLHRYYRNNMFFSFTLYPAHIRVGRGNLVLRHFVQNKIIRKQNKKLNNKRMNGITTVLAYEQVDR